MPSYLQHLRENILADTYNHLLFEEIEGIIHVFKKEE